MPNAKNISEMVVTAEQACELLGWKTARHVRRVAAREKWETRSSENPGRNGKREQLYLVSSLPAAARVKFEQGGVRETAIVPARTLSLFADAPEARPQEPSQPAGICLPDELRPQAEARYAAIEPLVRFSESEKRPKIRVSGERVISNLSDLAAYVAAQQNPPVSSRTLWRWYIRFKKHGYAALVDRFDEKQRRIGRADKGRLKFFEHRLAASAFIANAYNKEGLTARLTHDALVREWSRLDKGEPPNYRTTLRYLRGLPGGLTTLAREGGEAFDNKFSGFILRNAPPAMDWWIADHRWHDVLVRNTKFVSAARPFDHAMRLWLTAIYDWGSRKIVGYVWAPTPSSRTIGSALRMAVLSYGFPRKRFLWDNGKDFKKVKAELEAFQLSAELRGLLQCQRVEISSALPKHPRSKPIESYFARWSKRFDPLWRPAYCGNRPDHRPADCREAEKDHQRYLAGKRETSPLPTDVEFIIGAAQFAEEYNETALDALDGKTPNEVFDEHYPERTRPQIDSRVLAPLFWEKDTRKVLAGGCVELDRMRYEPVDLASLGPLHLQVGRTLLIARDPYSLGQAIAVDPATGKFIGELQIQPHIAQDPTNPTTRDQMRERMRTERSVKRAYADWIRSIDANARSFGIKSEKERLLERAAARTGTDDLPAALAPGAAHAQLPARVHREVAPTFVSDAVAQDAGIFQEIELED